MIRVVWVWVALGVLLVVRTGVRDRGVIGDHLEFGRRLVAGESLYAPHLEARPLHPVYPPSFGLMTWPLTLVPERAARFGWGLLQVLALWYLGSWLCARLRESHPSLVPRRHVVLLLIALLASRYILRDTHGGGGNLINLALALSAFDLAARGRTLGAGALLGLSLATKPTTVLLWPLLWLFGRRAAALTGLLAGAALVALALVLNGHGTAPIEQWLRGSLAYGAMDDVFATPAQGFPPFSWMNQCLRCASFRYLGTVPDSLAGEVPGFFQGLGLAPATVAWVARGTGAALLVATFAVAAWRRHADPSVRPALIAAVLCLSLLLSPISWKAHHVALIPAFFLLVVAWLSGSRTAAVGYVAYLLACVLGGGDIVGADVKGLQQSLYLATAGTVALWAFCLHRALADPGHAKLADDGPSR